MTPSAPCRRALKAVVAIETAVSEIDLFISSTGNFNVILEDMNSPLLHDAVPAQYVPHGGVPVALPAPTKSIRFLSLRHHTFKKRRCRDWEHSAAWLLLAERCSPSLIMNKTHGSALRISTVQILRVLCCVVD